MISTQYAVLVSGRQGRFGTWPQSLSDTIILYIKAYCIASLSPVVAREIIYTTVREANTQRKPVQFMPISSFSCLILPAGSPFSLPLFLSPSLAFLPSLPLSSLALTLRCDSQPTWLIKGQR
jgi:hypothetical protein